jgi:FkbM family methyltransferase
MIKISSSNQTRNNIYRKKFNKSKLLKKILPKKAVIFDVGSNIGQSVHEFNQILPYSKIYSFEPQINCVLLQKKKFSKNKNIKIEKIAFHNKVQKKKFYYHLFQSRNTSELSGFYQINKKSKDSITLNNLKNKKNYFKKLNKFEIIKTSKLDRYTSEKKIKRINLLKIDTQGNEVNILKGSINSLNKIDYILLEIMFYDYYNHNVSFYEIEKVLKKFKFKLFDITHVSKNPLTGGTDWVDVIYKKT